MPNLVSFETTTPNLPKPLGILNGMHKVMITSPADGAGRTTLAAALALYAEEAAEGLVVSLDANKDKGLLNWARKEKLARGITGAWDYSCTPENLQKLDGEGVELIMVDCDSSDQNERAANVREAVDLVVIVVRPKSEDLDSVGGLIDLLEYERKSFFFTINQATEDEDMITAAILSLAQHGTVSPVVLPHCPELGFLNRKTDHNYPSKQMVLESEIPRLWDYLHENLARHSKQNGAANEIDIPRPSEEQTKLAYGHQATFVTPEMVYPCSVIEISSDGLLFSSEVRIPPGFRLRFNLPYIGQLDCEVVEGNSEHLTARFIINEQRRAELIEQVDQLVRATREDLTCIN